MRPQRLLPMLVAAIVACAAPKAPPRGPDDARVERGGPDGPSIAAEDRYTPGQARLGLFVDVGSRDVGPAAAMLAWALAERAGPGAVGVAHPDALEVSLPVATADLPEGVARLAGALALRAVNPGDQARWATRLLRAARAAAGDPDRATLRLALGAAVGPAEASAFFPLPPPDVSPPTAAQLAELADAHLGPARALVVAVGDVPARALREAVSNAFRDAPRARVPRAARALPPPAPAPPLPLAVGAALPEAPAGVAAVFGADRADAARGYAEAAAAALRGTARVLRVRGGALGVATARDGEPAAHVTALALLAERWRAEGGPPPAAAAAPEDPGATLRRMGLDWAAGGPLDDAPPRWWGVGVVAPAASDAALAAAMAAAVPAPLPQITGGDGVRGTAEATLGNGALVRVERRPGPRVGVAVLHRGGGEPAHEAGLLALLVETAATSCAGLPPGALAARLGALGADLDPVLRPDAHGVVLTVPVERWRAGLDLALACAGDPNVTAPAVEAARRRLGRAPEDRRMRAWVGALIAPGAPQLVAAWGSLDDVEGASWRAVARRAAGLASAGDARVSIVGDVPVDDALARAARRVGRWPAGDARATGEARASRPAGPARAFPWDGATPRVVAAWVHRGPVPGTAAARLGAEALGEELAALARGLAGATPVWHGGGVLPDGAWVAVAFDAPSPERLLEALEGWRPTPAAGFEARVAARVRAHVEAGAVARTGAVRLALRSLGEGGPPALPDALTAAAALRTGALAVGLAGGR